MVGDPTDCTRRGERWNSCGPGRVMILPSDSTAPKTVPSCNHPVAPAQPPPQQLAAAYRALRLRALAMPLPGEQARRIARVMRRYLGLDEVGAERHGRRHVLLLREHLLHQTLLLDAPPRSLGELLDQVAVEGLEYLAGAVALERGLLLLSFHYSLFGSFLPLWLARAASLGGLPPVSLAFDSGAAGDLGLPEARVQELEAAGLLCRGEIELFDASGRGPVAEELLARLRAGRVVLAFPDVACLPPDDWRAVPVDAGAERLGLPRGLAWVALLAGCPLVPVAIRPRGDSHVLLFGPPTLPGSTRADDLRDAARVAMQRLWAMSVGVDPAPWHAWGLLPGGERHA